MEAGGESMGHFQPLVHAAWGGTVIAFGRKLGAETRNCSGKVLCSSKSTTFVTSGFCLFVLLRRLGFFPAFFGPLPKAISRSCGPFLDDLYQFRNS